VRVCNAPEHVAAPKHHYCFLASPNQIVVPVIPAPHVREPSLEVTDVEQSPTELQCQLFDPDGQVLTSCFDPPSNTIVLIVQAVPSGCAMCNPAS